MQTVIDREVRAKELKDRRSMEERFDMRLLDDAMMQKL